MGLLKCLFDDFSLFISVGGWENESVVGKESLSFCTIQISLNFLGLPFFWFWGNIEIKIRNTFFFLPNKLCILSCPTCFEDMVFHYRYYALCVCVWLLAIVVFCLVAEKVEVMEGKWCLLNFNVGVLLAFEYWEIWISHFLNFSSHFLYHFFGNQMRNRGFVFFYFCFLFFLGNQTVDFNGWYFLSSAELRWKQPEMITYFFLSYSSIFLSELLLCLWAFW